ncbi:MAG: divergent polysaccharide deacetylase family protein [Candidatus Omnitrophica bacterium]|nr:divergent polysaccharide deacetylase family protein [Candidatus Omnitrophota bacterium]
MKKQIRYKIVIWILSIIVILQTGLIIFLFLRKPVSKPMPLIGPRIAIVIDDWGYNLNNLELLKDIRYPLTVSILPNLAYSQVLAERLHSKGFEVILHLPLQPYEESTLENNTLTVDMDEETIKRILRNDLNSILYAKGVSNHMGSKATEDTRIMRIIFKELKKRNLYFLDSLVSANSICSDIALELKLPFAKRDMFIDNQEDFQYIANQIDKLKQKAKLVGQAIGIGHAREKTLKVLREKLPQLEKEGFRLVFVSELVR